MVHAKRENVLVFMSVARASAVPAPNPCRAATVQQFVQDRVRLSVERGWSW